MKKIALLAALLVVLVLVSAQVVVGEQQMVQEPVTAAQEAEEPEAPEIPFLVEWMSSGHNDTEAEAFNHWNEDDPPVVPTACAKCHSADGHRDFLGVDGTEAGVVDNDAPIGTTVNCVTCHNEATLVKDSVVMPSGAELTGLGREARCMECHQGRESAVSVNEAITAAGVDEDTVSPDLGFRNIHYFAAAATKYGTVSKGGYEYDGQPYDAVFNHVEGVNTCIACHNPHTLELKLEKCSTCHEGVAGTEDLKDVRMPGSLVDYDGDGDIEEGIYYELEGLREILYAGIQAYAAEVAGKAIVYEAASYPYFFIDTNENGEVDEGEADSANRYDAWTPRLVKATYNYQVSIKDPGAYAHGGKYIIELLYDSTADLNSAVAEPIDLAEAHRIDAGHFAGSEEAFRHWDEDGAVSGSCAKCHSAGGLPLYIEEGVNISEPLSNGLECTTCHNAMPEFTRHEVTEVRFPSGAVVSLEDADSNLCISCHQGRESTVSVNRLIGDKEDDVVSDGLRFLNIHYFAAGATRFGTEVKGAYEYDGQEYVGLFEHSNRNACTDCHDTHVLEVKWEECTECHEDVEGPEDLENIRYYFADYDGDGDDEEGIADEVNTMRDLLYEAIQAYATDVVETGIVYVSTNYPYFFIDTNGNGEADPDEISGDNRYSTWTPRLLRAAYNYQYSIKDPGAFAHNGQYILEILYDSLADLGADVSSMIRP